MIYELDMWLFFFFKQKTAYEMRISDWSSDVCSSDLIDKANMISVLILTKNEEQDLPGCLDSVTWCDDIHVYDSYSDDRTVEIAERYRATVTQRKFDNWSAHQNWGLSNIPFKYPWVLYKIGRAHV